MKDNIHLKYLEFKTILMDTIKKKIYSPIRIFVGKIYTL